MSGRDDVKTAQLFDVRSSQLGDILAAYEYPWQILSEVRLLIQRLARGRREGLIMAGATVLGDDVDIGPGTVVEPGAVIKGPAFIGAGCEIRAGAYIRGDAIILDRCVVGNSSEVKNAVMLEDSHAPHFNYVGDSVLGLRVNLGAGVKLSNWKITRDKSVVLRVGAESIDTGLNKFGAILGDDVEIGCNAVTNPGTIVGPRALIYGCANIRGIVPADVIVKFNQNLSIHPRRSE